MTILHSTFYCNVLKIVTFAKYEGPYLFFLCTLFLGRTLAFCTGLACGEPAISHDSHHVSLVQWTNLFAARHKGHRFKSPGGDLCETGILLISVVSIQAHALETL
jgi:hypothetical protein